MHVQVEELTELLEQRQHTSKSGLARSMQGDHPAGHSDKEDTFGLHSFPFIC